MKYRVRFLPDDREVEIEAGVTLLDAARAADVYVGSVCGGGSTCGKCRVIVKTGRVIGLPANKFLTDKEVEKGYRLACHCIPTTDLVVEVPPESVAGL